VLVPLGKNSQSDELNMESSFTSNGSIIVNTPKFVNTIVEQRIRLTDSLNNVLSYAIILEREKLSIKLTKAFEGTISFSIDSGAIEYFDGSFNEKLFGKRINITPPVTPAKLIINFPVVDRENVQLQLLNKNKGMLQSFPMTNESKLSIENLSPGTYYIRIYEDANQNGKWTTGSLENYQAVERTLLFSKPIEIKDNWDKEITLNF
jgi:hypothetical protein